MPRFSDSDRRFIERVRRLHRWRRPIGAVLFAIGLTATVGGFYYLIHLRRQAIDLFADQDTTTPTTQSIARMEDMMQFTIGLGIGMSCGLLILTGSFMATIGLFVLILGGRKDRLLLQAVGEAN